MRDVKFSLTGIPSLKEPEWQDILAANRKQYAYITEDIRITILTNRSILPSSAATLASMNSSAKADRYAWKNSKELY